MLGIEKEQRRMAIKRLERWLWRSATKKIDWQIQGKVEPRGEEDFLNNRAEDEKAGTSNATASR